MQDLAYFKRKSKVDPVTNCWNWLGARTTNGYGCLTVPERKRKNAHVIAYKNLVGHTSLFILHKCNNKLCVNPAHLYAGTLKDNSADMRAAKVGPFRVKQ
jgi:hypothetical protein